MTPTLTRAAFTAWLDTKADETTVGIPMNDEQCPIACFMTDTFKPESVSVCQSDMLTVIEGDEYVQKLSPWAVTFIEWVDDVDDFSINAGAAREILARIPDESEAAQ